MYKQVSKLIVYRDLGEDSILKRLASIFEDFDWYKENVLGSSSAFSASKLEEMKDKKHISKESLITRIYGEIKRHLLAHLPDTRQLSPATPACSSA